MKRKIQMRTIGLVGLFLTGSVYGLSWKGLDRVARECVEGSGLGKAELERRFDEIAAENRDEPFIVTKTKWMVELFDHARLSVLPDDRFVDCFPEWYLYTDRRDRRISKHVSKLPAPDGNVSTAWFDTSHTCPDWRAVLELGPRGLADRARKRLLRAKDGRERLFLQCVVDSYDAIVRLCLRWADVAEARGARACAQDLRAIAEAPPRTFAQALQWSLVYDRCQEAEGEDVRSQGAFDRLFLSYYLRDLAEGRETRASAKELVRIYFDKFVAQGHPNAKNIGLAGFDADGKPVWNDLTEIALELHDERNVVNPKFTFVYGTRTPREHLRQAARCLARGRTGIIFFNYDVAAEMFRRRGVEACDLADMGLIGCMEPGILGKGVYATMAGRINLVKPVEAALNNGRDFKGRKVGPPCAMPRDYASFEAAYMQQLEALVTATLNAAARYERDWYALNPGPIFSGTFAACLERARDAYDGGCKYNQSGAVLVGLGTAADSLAAVRYLVDETKAVTLEELAAILKNDWKGHEALRQKAFRLAPKWGNNDDRVDLIAKRIFNRGAAAVHAVPNGHGGMFQAGYWSIFLDMGFGNVTGATPDGRRNGQALSRNNKATAGCGKEGATAVILSNAKLDQADAPDGHVVDVVLPLTGKREEEATQAVLSILRTFAELKGQCLHMNCFSAALLKDARAHPEKYPDLQVRVCGWNVRWKDLSDAEKDHFIATAEAQE